MSSRLTMSILLVVFSIGLIWSYSPDQSRYERLNPAALRQPISAQQESDDGNDGTND
ncbi:hypothetical protein GB927_006220 [Shinella sp. CPCC 100929]|uniref:Uncharacterized protein n=1 Tax=Shinella lacus TaxID=2654216 RepID=A0ABT1R3A0_9HYPH|nr:hypothetical protein [Shinella lacus]MCQ4629625.1 hypothetical protein [Shinella lacus]